jgi:hypothetical protein
MTLLAQRRAGVQATGMIGALTALAALQGPPATDIYVAELRAHGGVAAWADVERAAQQP